MSDIPPEVHFDRRIDDCKESCMQRSTDFEKLMNAEFKSMQTALQLAGHKLDERLKEMNEFRDENRKLTKDFLTKDGYLSEHRLLEAKMDNYMKACEIKFEMTNKGRVSWAIASVVILLTSICAVLTGALIGHFLK
jgi:hypothetical protein